MSNVSTASRPAEIFAARGMAILLVVYAHGLVLFYRPGAAPVEAAFAQWQFLASCGMPFFFIASGLVYRVKSHRKAVATSLTFILLAYVYHLIAWNIGNVFDDSAFTLRLLVTPLIKSSGLLPTPLWFIVTLAYVQLAYHFFQRNGALGKGLIVSGLLMAFAAGHLSGYNFFYVRAVVPAFFFLALGHALSKSDVPFMQPARAWQRWVLLGSLMLATAVLADINGGCLFDPRPICKHPEGTFSVFLMDGEIGFLPVFVAGALVGSYAFWLLVRQLVASAPSVGRWLTRIGRNSLTLFTLNAFVLMFVEMPLHPFVPEEVPLWLLVGAPVGLCIAQVALMPWWRHVNDALLKVAGQLAKFFADRLQLLIKRERAPARSRARLAKVAHAEQPSGRSSE